MQDSESDCIDMESSSRLVFSCFDCSDGNIFVIFGDEVHLTDCCSCGKHYDFDSDTKQELAKFVDLYTQIQASADLLGDASIVVSTENGQVQIPFNLLLTRFPVVLNLKFDNREISLRFVFDAVDSACLYQDSMV